MKPVQFLIFVAVAASPLSAQTSSRQASVDAARSTSLSTEKAKLICRTSIETGSNAKRVRRCATAEGWRRGREGENDAARRMVQDNTGLVNGN
jgi:hypothetical protein